MTKIAKASRESDDRILEWLRLHKDGHTFARIARWYGVTDSVVLRACRAVRDHDLMRAWDPRSEIEAAYA